MKIKSYAAKSAGQPLELYEYDAGELGSEEVEVTVDYCGLCHSDLSMLDNEWGMSNYPVVAGHEVSGRVSALGKNAENKGLVIGQKVGIGWTAKSCQHCDACIRGNHSNCENGTTPTIINKGGFAEKIRADWQWVIPLPEALDPSLTGPLLCGGITVFKPLLMSKINAMSRVGVIGIGGLGHIAIKLLKALGAEVVAFSSNPSKKESILELGADEVVNSRDKEELSQQAGKFDLIVSTVAVNLDWKPYFAALAPEGKFHTVGIMMKPIEVNAVELIRGDKSIGGSSTGSPSELRSLLKLSARKKVTPKIEMFPMSQINDAIEHLRAGKANFRIVLKADFE